jgi:hypothetical protein
LPELAADDITENPESEAGAARLSTFRPHISSGAPTRSTTILVPVNFPMPTNPLDGLTNMV